MLDDNASGISAEQLKEAAANWDRCIGPIRKKYEKQIKADQYQHQMATERQVFRYEHPDLEREGIVWR
jgi:hypothetical protein